MNPAAPSSPLPASPAARSRFLQRWLGADPARQAQLDELSGLSLADVDLGAALARQRDAGQSQPLPLPRAMRRLRNLLVCAIIRRDLEGQAGLDEVVTAMTRFADFAIQTHTAALAEELVAAHGMPTGEESGRPQELMVLSMGKGGGGELNVSSDIDLIFVYPEDGETAAGPGQRQLSNHEFFVRLGRRLNAALSEVIEDGFTFRVDMALRPNGNSGPLAASLAMVEEYLIVQGREWERYAWVKARAVTGTLEDIAALDAIVRPFVFRRYLDFGVIDAIRNMHAQIRAEVKRQERLHPERSHNVKLGRGGIREIEFLAQVFQLIRGGRDPALRERSTRATLRLLAERELLTQDTVARLLEAYTFLRNLEHRLQYLDDAQTHTLPASEEDRLAVAQMMGLPDVATLLDRLEQQRSFVAAQFDAIFADKSEGTEAEGVTLADDPENREAIATRLAELGYDDPPSAAARLVATLQGPRLASLPEASRARLLALSDAALGRIASVVREAGIGSHAATLGRLLDLFEAIARRSAYLSLLTEYPHTLERVIRMINASGWAATFLTQHPILLDELLDDRNEGAADVDQLASELDTQLGEAAGDTERQLDILREAHHAQLFRLLALDLAGELSVERLADHLSLLADTIVGATIRHAWRTVASRHREEPRFAVIAYGKLGGKELGYVSDLDVIFLYDDEDEMAPSNYARLAQRFITWNTAHTAAGILFDIDTALRPDGASGMLVSTVAAFERYQNASAWIWEHQALTRARFCAGDAAIGARFEAIREQVLRKDRSGQEQQLKSEVCAMRRRMRETNVNPGSLFDLKQDEGGMIDIEFIVQYLVLRHAASYPQLTANAGNIALLRLCGELGLVDATLAAGAADAYRVMRRLQHQVRLQGQEKARVDPQLLGEHPDRVRRLWQACFGA
ncbi:bifunctional [glutamate--ammonia ligase]-adenylyl-L-tyrosine phosphorylase/[glutamate--ammonia-ligase] adenylyltransferase [Massilia sp. IC2-476]|uniref:bifunctional [glutamate--ammonia ligase]-adenylyl-L-tyrosine phosphorylase/[glutamate--ammonia-ligase] adenylyltransferase n=1 Tax=Massilia sp. IC2-476 TaxID=2887199 RepID=UPI001D12DF25|nr:bifunctional [glutamate--ammonia ligase]-adenylyl-L-tyrosine phosphorylase/[glutamate--ammonia-ligase] adenylyltransferase [Massilia sp. IC2-476]MCC2971713.1 bifunctional [glutamate--ammonia ligase]-adenylyl-L-tyrosine phosphorylase/[glutamate--ammonia-ligase] adenylyltransferase [Massilia sp. IC2-476]